MPLAGTPADVLQEGDRANARPQENVMRPFRRLWFAALPILALAAPAAAGPRVRTASGVVEGSTAAGVVAFNGIPYAAPPLGPGRWRAPGPAVPWHGVRDATRFGHSCWQAVSPQGFGPWSHEYVVDGDISEDCLFLNVWAPAHRRGASPVLVWIHGGGFNSGSGAIPIYDGAALAARGAVVVTINYRVGVFGFLAHPEITREAGDAPTNFGLLDVIAALRWVRSNIAAFGGDPRLVTIAGQSAGAMAAQELVAAPAAKGLFARAIGESGLPRPLPSLATAEAQGLAFAREKGAASVAALRALPAATLQPATGANAVRFVPVADGRLLASGPWRAASDVPMLVGLNADEGSAGDDYRSSDPAKLEALLRSTYGTVAGRAAALYPAATATERAEASVNLRRDAGLGALDAWATLRGGQARQPAFGYLFTHAEPGAEASRWGAFHSSEIPYVFGTLAAAPERAFTADDRRLSDRLAAMWLSFMRKGDPNGPGLPTWPALTTAGPTILRIGDVPRPQPLLPPLILKLARQSRAETLQTGGP
jgi:para-nitrobenzyl esterase